MTKPAQLHPRLSDLKFESRNPPRMDRLKCSEEQRILFESEALSIYADCCNAGLSLRSTLSAILISGFDWGIQASKAKTNETKD
jgi:hypothetical protein